jgi:GTPase SAR1 family protein
MNTELNKSNWREWTVQHVVTWIQSLHIKHYEQLIQTFTENEVDGETLEYWLSTNKNIDEILKDNLNIASMRIRMQFTEALLQLFKTDSNDGVTNVLDSGVISSALQYQFEDFAWQKQSLTELLPELERISSELRSREHSNIKRLQNEEDKLIIISKEEGKEEGIPSIASTYSQIRSKFSKILYDNKQQQQQPQPDRLDNLLDSNTDLIRSEDIRYLDKAINEPLMILVLGDLKSGKSCFINAMLKEEILPSTAVPCTSTIVHLKYSKTKMLKIHYFSEEELNNSSNSIHMESGKLKLKDLRRNFKRFRSSNSDMTQPRIDTIYLSDDTQQVPQKYVFVESDESTVTRASPYSLVEVYWPNDLLKHGIELVDTPGLNESELFDNIVEEYIPKATACCCIINCEHTITDSVRIMLTKYRMKLKQFTTNSNNEDLFFICNKYEYVDQKNRERFKSYLLSQLAELFPHVKQHCLYTISAKDAITSVRENKPAPPEFIQMQHALVQFIRQIMDKRIKYRHFQLRDSIRKCEKFIIQQQTLVKSQEQERQLYLQKLDEAQESLKKWTLDCTSVIHQTVKELQSRLTQFWSQCYPKLKCYIRDKLTTQSARTTTELKFRSDLNQHLEWLFAEFYHSDLLPLLTTAKRACMMIEDTSGGNKTLKSIFDSLQQIQDKTHVTNVDQNDHNNSNGNNSSNSNSNGSQWWIDVDYKPSTLSEMASCYRSLVGQTVLWQIVAAPVIFPYSTVVFVFSGPTTHFYDQKLYRKYAKKLVQAQLLSENISFAANKMTDHLIQSRDLVQEVCQTAINNEKYMISSTHLSVAIDNPDSTNSNCDNQQTFKKLRTLKERVVKFSTDCMERHWKFDHRAVKRIECLGRGNLGMVYLVEYRGKKLAMKEIWRNRPVAVYLREAVLLRYVL